MGYMMYKLDSQRGVGIPSYVVAKANGVMRLRRVPLCERRFSSHKFDASARRRLRCQPYTRADLDSAVPLLALIPLLPKYHPICETFWG